jgi:polyferredoxin
LMQEVYGKRIWCKYFCPLGKVLNLVVKRVR